MELVSYNEMYNELLHSGIKGMKWGVRRYQNPDGTLTTAGKMRYNKEMAKLRKEEKVLKNREATAAKLKKLEDKKNEIAAKKAELDGNGKAKKSDTDDGDSKSITSRLSRHKEKKVSEMTNEEIQAKIDRINLEKKYKALVDELEGKSNNSDSNSKTKSEPSKAQKTVEEIVTNSVKNIGTQSVSYLLGVGANKLLEGVANDKQAINPKKGQKDK